MGGGQHRHSTLCCWRLPLQADLHLAMSWKTGKENRDWHCCSSWTQQWISHGNWQENQVSSFCLCTGKTLGFILNHLSFGSLLWSLQVCFLMDFFIIIFYCHFCCAIWMRDFNGKAINLWKSRGCRSHKHSSSIKVWLGNRDLKKLPPLFLRVRFMVWILNYIYGDTFVCFTAEITNLRIGTYLRPSSVFLTHSP